MATTKKKKTVGRLQQFGNLAGGHNQAARHDRIDEITTDSAAVSGVVGGLAAAQSGSGHRVRQVDVKALIPHPFNDPARSQPAEGNEKWEELVRGVRSQGVQLPGLAVTRTAFLAARPQLADSVDSDGTYVLVYGHRRRAAALHAGVSTMPVVVNDAVLADDGDLDLMAMENLGREDPSDIAQARLFARYSEVGLTQSEIAARLGVDQGTVSRRLSLLLLTDEAMAAVNEKRLPGAAASVLAGALPYGPERAWQRSKHTDQDTPERHDDQVAALHLILDRTVTPSRAAELVLAIRRSRAEAATRGIIVVDDPGEALGGAVVEVVDATAVAGEVVGTIDSITGSLLLWSRLPAPPAASAPAASPSVSAAAAATDEVQVPHEQSAADTVPSETTPTPSSPPPPAEGQVEPGPAPVTEPNRDERVEAARARGEACARAARQVPSKVRVAEIMVEAIAHGVDLTSPRVVAQAEAWAPDDGGESADAYAARAAVAWRRVLAGYEAAAIAAGDSWGPVQASFVELLVDRARFVPTAWERRVMHAA